VIGSSESIKVTGQKSGEEDVKLSERAERILDDISHGKDVDLFQLDDDEARYVIRVAEAGFGCALKHIDDDESLIRVVLDQLEVKRVVANAMVQVLAEAKSRRFPAH
jgi:type II secretory pathway component PulM